MAREHGTRARYLDGPDENDQPGPCRCGGCRGANTAFQRETRRRKAERQWGAAEPAFVDAEPVRAHVKMLVSHGMGWKRVAELSGVAEGAVCRLLYGAGGKPPTVRVRPRTARRIMAVQPNLDVFSDRSLIDGAGTRRRVQALAVLGWSISAQAREIGWHPANLWALANTPRQVAAATARLVRDLYARLSMRPAPPSASATKARRMAAAKGWLSPLAWEDDLIDVPDDQLDVELARRVAEMDDAEMSRCWTAHYKDGDRSPLIAAAARECDRRRKARRPRKAVAS